MKKAAIICSVALLFVLGESTTTHADSAQHVLTSELNFSAELQNDDSVITRWNQWDTDFMWYKVIRSQTNPDPTYHTDGHIFFSVNQQTTEFIDTTPPVGKSFYRVCVWTHTMHRYCSNVISIDTAQESLTADRTSFCTQVITPAKNPTTDECREFPTPCDVPKDWQQVQSCANEDAPDEQLITAVNVEERSCRVFNGEAILPPEYYPTPLDLICDSSTYTLTTEALPEGIKLAWQTTLEQQTPITVWRLDSMGKWLSITETDTSEFTDTTAFANGMYAYFICETTENGCGSTSSVVFAETTAALSTEPGNSTFTDINPQTEAGQAIVRFAENGVVNGFEDNTFRPEKNLTRAELSKIITLGNSIEPTKTGEQYFCDVPVGQWFHLYVNQFFVDGYINGFPGSTCQIDREFRPHEPVLRSEAVKMMLEASGYTPETVSLSEEPYGDVPTNHWFAPYAALAEEQGFFNGVIEEDFRPDQAITRGEAMLYLYRIMNPPDEYNSAPKIVDHFACSYNCPGEADEYTVRIYEGITDENRCSELKGTLHTYYLWGETTVCLIPGQSPPVINADPQNTIFCDAQTPCESGNCYVLPGAKQAQCIELDESDICSVCESNQCMIAESYPPQVVCIDEELQ